jgi:hypothetical protein
VTEDDLKKITRATRGHISLSAINEALEEVQAFARSKAARMRRERRAASKMRSYPNSSSPRYRNPIRRDAAPLEDPEMILTEQELRQACAFFRSGEATARSLLLILCAVNRLKQGRGGKNGLVYYHIPVNQQRALPPPLD